MITFRLKTTLLMRRLRHMLGILTPSHQNMIHERGDCCRVQRLRSCKSPLALHGIKSHTLAVQSDEAVINIVLSILYEMSLIFLEWALFLVSVHFPASTSHFKSVPFSCAVTMR